jgi:hypothetical protein
VLQGEFLRTIQFQGGPELICLIVWLCGSEVLGIILRRGNLPQTLLKFLKRTTSFISIKSKKEYNGVPFIIFVSSLASTLESIRPIQNILHICKLSKKCVS